MSSSDNIVINADGPARPRGAGLRLALVAVALVALALLGLLGFVWSSTSSSDRRIVVLGMFALLGLLGLCGVLWAFNKAQQAAIVKLPGDYPITYAQLQRAGLHYAGDALQGHFTAQAIEAARPYPAALQHLSISNTAAPPAPALPVVEAVEALQALPADDWLQWVDQQAHVILAAQTGAGKSTTAQAILAARVARGEHIFIIDPHSSGWFDLPAVARGQNWQEAQQAIEAVAAEYFDRQRQRKEAIEATGRELPHDYFPRLTVVLDEALEARKYLDQGPRGRPSPWEYFAQVLGSGGRKCGISAMLSTQSALVDDLGLSSKLRSNFAQLALDYETIKALIERSESDHDRRAQLFAALQGLQYPAATVQGAQVVLLDRTGLDQRPRPASAASSIWPGWAAYQAQLPAGPAAPAQQLQPTQQLTQEGQILQALADRGPSTSRAVAASLGLDPQLVRTILKTMYDAGRVDRSGPKGRFIYKLINQ